MTKDTTHLAVGEPFTATSLEGAPKHPVMHAYVPTACNHHGLATGASRHFTQRRKEVTCQRCQQIAAARKRALLASVS